MPSVVEAAGIYRREAERLRGMAETGAYRLVREGLLGVADRYELMASQAEDMRQHAFGRPLRRAPSAQPVQPEGS